MSHLPKKTSKLSSLEAARAIYFIVVGLAIKQSLVLFSHEWPPQNTQTPFAWWALPNRTWIGLGYLLTTLRFSHGVSLLYAFEKERIEKSALPSASKVLTLSIFLISLAIFLFLMADNLPFSFPAYLTWAGFLLLADILFIAYSGVIKTPYKFVRRWNETIRGTAPRAALQWMASDVILLVLAIVLIGLWIINHEHIHEHIYASFLIFAAITDYWMNREHYFGGKNDRRKQKIVFVCSPLMGIDDGTPIIDRLSNNIRRAQFYCNTLITQKKRFRSKVIPFASHCFFTYFLHDDKPKDRILGTECAFAFLSACDAIYVYLPFEEKKGWFRTRQRPKEKSLSSGMERELEIAKGLGLEIKYFPEKAISALPDTWLPQWKPLDYLETPESTDDEKAIFESFVLDKTI